jgi:hypothetical protein
MLLAGWLLALCVTLAWWRSSALTEGRVLLSALTLLLAAAVMLRGWLRSPAGQLQWDGECWGWESPVYRSGIALEPPMVLLDLQHAFLLRLDNRAGAVWWLWAERSALPPRWLDLRRAVFAAPKLDFYKKTQPLS